MEKTEASHDSLASAYVDLLNARDPQPLVHRLLELLCLLTPAQAGYVQVRRADSGQMWRAHVGLNDQGLATAEGRISASVVQAALAANETVHTDSAMIDPRFAERESVRAGEIEAVLCVPLHAPGVDGVVYLQNSVGGGPFGQDDVHSVEVAARFVAEVAGRLVEQRRRRDKGRNVAELRARLNAEHIVGTSQALGDVLARVEVVARMDVSVLLLGPTGSGKSMLARVVHDNSRRASGPYVELNCANLPDTLLESELFGADRGAHSGVSHRGTIGKVTAAEGGTLFLDEIAELTPAAQAKLLQLLESGEFYRLGSTQRSVADVRFVAATNRDLEEASRAGTFRADLYYRIRGTAVTLPSLEERREDVPTLAELFVENACRSSGVEPLPISVEGLAALESAPWPGQIRELAGRCQDAVINACLDQSSRIEVHHLFGAAPREAGPDDRTLQAATQRFQAMFIRQALLKRDWNVSQTARDLAMSRSRLHELMKLHRLRRDDETRSP